MNTLCLVICAFIGLSQACEMPPAGPEIDWSKMLGKHWHEVVNNKPALDENFGCFELIYENEIPGGYTTRAYTKNSNGDVEQLDSHLLKTSDGYYTVDFGQGNPDDFLKDLMETKTGVQKGEDEFMQKLAYYTDHENYLLALGCSEDDRMEVWHFASNRTPSTEDVLRVTNILGQIGRGWDRLQLSFDKCVKK